MALQERFASVWSFLNSEAPQWRPPPWAQNLILGLAALKIGWDFWPYMRPSSLGYYYCRDCPTWALVTGASDGIGRAFAEELLSRGFNVLIHGRNPAKLEALRVELLKQHPKRMVDIVVADAGEADVDYDAIVSKVKGLDGKLTILVNNVGGSITSNPYIPLDEARPEDIDTTINVNARFPTHLTARLLPILKQNSPAAILACSSVAGVLGMPYLVTYSSTKAYIMAFCSSVKCEMSSAAEGKGHHVDVLGLLIGNVKTKGNDHDDTPLFTITAKQTAAGALNKIGCSRSIVWAHWRHALSFHFTQLVPESIFRQQVAGLLKRRRADMIAREKQQ